MKSLCRKSLISVAIAALFSASLVYGNDSVTSSNGNGLYRFESEARAVLAEAGADSSRDPKLSVDATGSLKMLAVYGEQGQQRLGFTSSPDGGDSFAALMQITQKEARVHSHGENSPSVAFGFPYVYALWEQSMPEGGTELVFARANARSGVADKPVRVTDKAAPSTNGFSSMGAAPNGDIYVVWLDGRRKQAGTFSVYLAKSTDKGATFGKNVLVSDGVCPCCRTTLAFGNKGEVYVTWRHVFENDFRDMVVATSTNGGETFSAPVRVAEDGWQVNVCPHTGPAMGVKGNRLYIAWHSEGNGTNPGIRVSWSDDGGKSFTRPAVISKDVLDTSHPAISISEDGRMVIVFQGRDRAEKDGWGPVRPFLAEIDQKGIISPPVLVPGSHKSISYPAVVAGTLGRVFVAWTEQGEKGNQVMLVRGRRSTP